MVFLFVLSRPFFSFHNPGNGFDISSDLSVVTCVSFLPKFQRLDIDMKAFDFVQRFAREVCGVALPSGLLRCQDWSPVIKFLHRCHSLCCLLLRAAAACPVFGPRAANAHCLQPHALLRIRPSQRAHALAMHLWRAEGFASQRSRARLLRFSCMLAAVAALLSSIGGGSGGSRHAALIIRRCLSMHGVNYMLRLSRDVDDDDDDDDTDD
jgi:hypothetical protein